MPHCVARALQKDHPCRCCPFLISTASLEELRQTMGQQVPSLMEVAAAELVVRPCSVHSLGAKVERMRLVEAAHDLAKRPAPLLRKAAQKGPAGVVARVRVGALKGEAGALMMARMV